MSNLMIQQLNGLQPGGLQDDDVLAVVQDANVTPSTNKVTVEELSLHLAGRSDFQTTLSTSQPFVEDIAGNSDFTDALLADTVYLSALGATQSVGNAVAGNTDFKTTLLADTPFLEAIAASTPFGEELVGNLAVQEGLANNSTFLSELTTNPTFVGAVEDLIPTNPEILTTVSSSSGTLTLNCSLGRNFKTTLTENVTTLTLTNLAGATIATSFEIEIKQNGTGGFTFALPASFKALGGSDTAIATAPNAVTVLSAKTFDNGTTWRYAMQESA